MVLPLLAGAAALMGAGYVGQRFGNEYFEDRAIDRSASRQSDLLNSLPEGHNGDQFSAGAFGSGLMNPQDYARTGFNDQRQAADHSAAMARQQASSGAAMARQQQAQQFALQQQEIQRQGMEAQTSARLENLKAAGYDVNPFTPQSQIAAWEEKAFGPGPQTVDLAGVDAAAPHLRAATRAGSVVGQLQEFSRLGVIDAVDSDAKASRQDLNRLAQEAFFDWKNEIYGDAEPSPDIFRELQENFRKPGGIFEDRELTARAFAMMQAESERRGEYEAARFAVQQGRSAPEILEDLNYGSLTLQERLDINTGRILDLPEGVDPVDTFSSGQSAPQPGPFNARGGR